MKDSSKYQYLSTGLAMFSMFFGAGNIIFPLVLGHSSGNLVLYALLGLLLTAVGVPFLGLIGIILYKGNYKVFFERMGSVPGLFFITVIMLLIGPFGGIPRCIALSYSTLQSTLSGISINWFSLFSCAIIFLFTFKKTQILNLLGNILTPFLLISLLVIMIAGFLFPGEQVVSTQTPFQAFNQGLLEGYNTMDLLASFFFSSIVYQGLRQQFETNEVDHDKRIFYHSLKAGLFGAVLLSIVYVGFSYVASIHSDGLNIQEQDQLLGSLTLKILGPYAGFIASIAIALACLTTAIALSAVFSEFLQKTIFKHKISYSTALLSTLLVTFGVSTLEFKGIVKLLAPILQISYPALIVLTIANIASRLYNFKPVKTPVYFVLGLGIVTYLFGWL